MGRSLVTICVTGDDETSEMIYRHNRYLAMDRPLVRAAEPQDCKGLVASEANSELQEARDRDPKDPGKLRQADLERRFTLLSKSVITSVHEPPLNFTEA
jgi:hypothetical protein